jgi:hypothetical protein
MTVRDIRDLTVLKAIRYGTSQLIHGIKVITVITDLHIGTVRSDLDSEFSDSEHLVPFEYLSLSSIP